MKRRSFGFFALVLAIIFAMVFGACGEGGLDIQGLLDDLGVKQDYPDGVEPGPGHWEVGQTGPGGGVIVYVVDDPDGFEVEGYGKAWNIEIALPEGDIWTSWIQFAYDDFPAAFMSSGITVVDDADSSDPLRSKIGNGRKDTKLLVDYLNGAGLSGYAAQVAVTPQGGKDDWFLPSAGESELMIGHIPVDLYTGQPIWTSSLAADNAAYCFDAVIGNNSRYTGWQGFVIPIRAF